MPLITLKEIFDIFIMVFAVGYIFMDFIIPHHLRGFRREVVPQMRQYHFDWRIFRIAVYITAPALIFHELAHKFVAMALGYVATFKAIYFGLLIGFVLRWIHSPFIFVIPGGVFIPGIKEPLHHLLIAFSGPALNLALFIAAWAILKYKKAQLEPRWVGVLHATKVLNLFWFIINMLPIPGIDGYHVYVNLFKLFGGA